MLGGQRVEAALLLRLQRTAFILKYKVAAADDRFLSVNYAGNAMRDDIFHMAVHLLVGNPPHFCLLHHGVGDGMGIVFLQAGRDA